MSAAHGPDPLRGIPLEALRGFEAAARLLNFTRAAEELHLTQSAVSREIRSLEERLGTRLFERAKGGLRLTPAGVALQHDVSAALATMRRGIERATGTASQRSFVVVTNRSMLSDWLWGRVADYTNRHPEIDLRLAPAPRTGTPESRRGLDDIDATDMDIGIRLLSRATADGRWERLMTEYVFPCARKRSPRTSRGRSARSPTLRTTRCSSSTTGCRRSTRTGRCGANGRVSRGSLQPPGSAFPTGRSYSRSPPRARASAWAASRRSTIDSSGRARSARAGGNALDPCVVSRAVDAMQERSARQRVRGVAGNEARREEAFAREFLAGKRVIGD